MKPPIKDKRDMYDRLARGELGNHIPQWMSLAEWRASGYVDPVGIRTMNSGAMQGGGPFLPHVPHDSVVEVVKHVQKAGYSVNISPMFPDKQIVCCGEVCRTTEGVSLYWSPLRIPYRDALKMGGKQTYRVHALEILLHYLYPCSYDELMELLDEYPDHAVEFTTYDRCVGVMPHRNTIIWEVRAY
jgi:hypothetical protein